MSDTSNQTTDRLGALRPWSDAAARLSGHQPDSGWRGFEFSGVPGEGMYVTGRVGRWGKKTTVFVALSEPEINA